MALVHVSMCIIRQPTVFPRIHIDILCFRIQHIQIQIESLEALQIRAQGMCLTCVSHYCMQKSAPMLYIILHQTKSFKWANLKLQLLVLFNYNLTKLCKIYCDIILEPPTALNYCMFVLGVVNRLFSLMFSHKWLDCQNFISSDQKLKLLSFAQCI